VTALRRRRMEKKKSGLPDWSGKRIKYRAGKK
jgi:hypothetical protein